MKATGHYKTLKEAKERIVSIGIAKDKIAVLKGKLDGPIKYIAFYHKISKQLIGTYNQVTGKLFLSYKLID